ncbi:MAG: hypothetical protein AABY26_00205, partial [Nanoarchaeota archaeon]
MSLLEKIVRLCLAGVLVACTPEEAESRKPKPHAKASIKVEKICNLEALYLGSADTVKEVRHLVKGGCAEKDSTPNFPAALEAMWDYKTEQRASGNPAAQQAAKLKMEQYSQNPRHMSLEKYVQLADAEAAKVQKELDWERVALGYKLSPDKQKLLQRAMAQIRGRELIAYGMTELFPSHNGNRNEKLLDRLLR